MKKGQSSSKNLEGAKIEDKLIESKIHMPASTNNRNRMYNEGGGNTSRSGKKNQSNRHGIAEKRIKPNKQQANMFKGTAPFGMTLTGKPVKANTLKHVHPYPKGSRDGLSGAASDVPDFLLSADMYQRSRAQTQKTSNVTSVEASAMEHIDDEEFKLFQQSSRNEMAQRIIG